MKTEIIHVTGLVQGVGFRPHVHRLATENGLTGWVKNDSQGSTITLSGHRQAISRFCRQLITNPPPLAKINRLSRQTVSLQAFSEFQVAASDTINDQVTCLISPDVAICPDCRRELFDPRDLRYYYPYINCTNCGPRYTIVMDVPYDRPRTTMRAFELCCTCSKQYHDPSDRRFHAQPVACPICGPSVHLIENAAQIQSFGPRVPLENKTAIRMAADLLRQGYVVAIKGIGGYHFACDGTNEAAVERLRSRKEREEKPLALMVRDLSVVQEIAYISRREQDLLTSSVAPIVLLKSRRRSAVAPGVAPGNRHLGLMLPYTPLQVLLYAEGAPPILVMTSGNRSDEPIAYEDEDAIARLGDIADAFLIGNRPIHIRCDDSIAKVMRGATQILRRSRGLVPMPFTLPMDAGAILAVGAELKNTFCLTRGNQALMSHHIGDLKNWTEYEAFRTGIEHLKRLFYVNPEIITCDLHPDYLSTRYAERSGLPIVRVQHHHAHIASVMAEHGLPDEKVIGVAFDGVGMGDDGTAWGCEFFIADYRTYQRFAHLKPVRLPGGDAAAREPWRSAAAFLYEAGGRQYAEHALVEMNAAPAESIETALHLIESGHNAPLAVSAGRLFDAVASILQVRQRCSFEGQAAMELENLAAQRDIQMNFRFQWCSEDDGWLIDFSEVIQAILEEHRRKRCRSHISASFHLAFAQMIADGCRLARDRTGCNTVCLSGGTFQNSRLTNRCLRLLKPLGFAVYLNRQVPPNDGGIALGQAAVAASRSLK